MHTLRTTREICAALLVRSPFILSYGAWLNGSRAPVNASTLYSCAPHWIPRCRVDAEMRSPPIILATDTDAFGAIPARRHTSYQAGVAACGLLRAPSPSSPIDAELEEYTRPQFSSDLLHSSFLFPR
jgi:hypothetical protein